MVLTPSPRTYFSHCVLLTLLAGYKSLFICPPSVNQLLTPRQQHLFTSEPSFLVRCPVMDYLHHVSPSRGVMLHFQQIKPLNSFEGKCYLARSA